MSESKKGGAHLQKKEKKHLTRKEKIRLAVILVLVTLLALLLVGFAIYRSWAKAPDIPVQPTPTPPQTAGDSPDVEVDNAETPVEPVSDRKKDFYTFLVVGRDTGGGGNTDTMLLAAYDVANQKLNVMSIPRDTMVNVPWEIKRINSVYNMYGGGEKGLQSLYDEVSQLVGFVPDFEVVVEWEAVGDLVDAIGGVWFDVPFRMYYNDLSQGFIIDLQAGYQLLDGDAAMDLVRYRKQSDDNGNVTGGYPNGDIGRIETQQAFLKEIVKQCLQIKNVTRIQELAKVFTDNVQTDLTLGNLVWFAEQAIFGGLSMDNVNFITLPGEYNGYAWSPTYQNNQSYVLPDAEGLLKVVNENFNPYLEDRTMEQLDIMSVNSDGSVSSTTGVVEDKVAAKPPVYPTPKPEPEVTEKPEGTEEPEPSEQPGTTEPSESTGEPVVTEEPGTEEETEESEDPAAVQEPETTEEPEPSGEISQIPDWLRPAEPSASEEVITELPPIEPAA